MKNFYRRQGVEAVDLYYLTQNRALLPDLSTICRLAACAPLSELEQYLGRRLYDHILVESETHRLEQPGVVFATLATWLAPGGQLLFTCSDLKVYLQILRALGVTRLEEITSLKDYYFCYTNRPD
jgi:hypothetical protein